MHRALLPRFLFVLSVLTALAEAGDTEIVLKYHNEAPVGKQAIGGSGELIEFFLAARSLKLTGLRVHGARYGAPEPPQESFLIFVLNADRSRVIAVEMLPFHLFELGAEQWVDLVFEQPIAVPERFWVALDFRAGPSKGVFVSYDTSSLGKHSLIGLPGMESRKPKHGGDWMIEAVVLAEEIKPVQHQIPESLSVEDALTIIAAGKLRSQGCGGGTWNNEKWGLYVNNIQPLRLPWNSEPQAVVVVFVYGRDPVEHHLIELSGEGFKFRRTTNDPILLLEIQAKSDASRKAKTDEPK